MIVVNIPVQNFQGVTVHLEAGTRLGNVKSVTVLPLNQCTTDVSSDGATVGAMECSSERLEQLYRELNFPLNFLSLDEARRLRRLVGEFSNVFALDDSELG